MDFHELQFGKKRLRLILRGYHRPANGWPGTRKQISCFNPTAQDVTCTGSANLRPRDWPSGA